MGKPDSRQRNVRLKLDAWFELADLANAWGCAETAALERAIRGAHAVFCGGATSVTETVLPPGMDVVPPSEIPGISVGIKNATCQHCGEKFAGARYAVICPGCKDGGHFGDVRECRGCQERDGGAL